MNENLEKLLRSCQGRMLELPMGIVALLRVTAAAAAVYENSRGNDASRLNAAVFSYVGKDILAKMLAENGLAEDFQPYLAAITSQDLMEAALQNLEAWAEEGHPYPAGEGETEETGDGQAV